MPISPRLTTAPLLRGVVNRSPALRPPPVVRLPALPVTTAPASTTDTEAGRARTLLLLTLTVFSLPACGQVGLGRHSPAPTPAGVSLQREAPALSAGGRMLASLLPRSGRPTLLLQELPSGRSLPIGPLARWTSHRSPSVSRNGRYVALLVLQGDRSLPLIWDRVGNRLHHLPLPPDLQVQRLQLAPDGRRVVIELWQDGRSALRLFDLTGLLEPDLPGGLIVQGGGPEPLAP